jgi:hypothetical protein
MKLLEKLPTKSISIHRKSKKIRYKNFSELDITWRSCVVSPHILTGALCISISNEVKIYSEVRIEHLKEAWQKILKW